MSTLSDLVLAQGRSSEADVEWLHLLVGDWQLLADLAFADMVLWVPTAEDGSFVAVAHARPSTRATLFYRDFVGQEIREEWRDQVTESFGSSRDVDSAAPDWYEDTPTRVRAVPVLRRLSPKSKQTTDRPIAVDHPAHEPGRVPHPQPAGAHLQPSARTTCSRMIATGDFPDLGAPTGPRRGAPRASDGLIRLDVDGIVTFASPNGLQRFNRMGFDGRARGEVPGRGHDRAPRAQLVVDESLPLVVTGRAPWRTDIEAKGVTVSLRAIPLRDRGERVGAIVLCRDVTELRHQERELITKDATIREIHHRVKNNLQTVASLLRIQARRTHSDEARDVAQQAMRRVAAIAVVHDTLSRGSARTSTSTRSSTACSCSIAEVASSHNTTVHPKNTGSFGALPSEYATPLALGAHRTRDERGRARPRRARRRGRDRRPPRRTTTCRSRCATTASACRRARSAPASARRSSAR